jgi:hypothetical protein
MLAGVDLVIGPLLTFVIASARKPRRTLARDIAAIALIQLSALVYGTVMLWNGRPLYYAFSEDVLQVVQAYDLEPAELALARQRKVALMPHWYSLPRWIWAPLPENPQEQERIVNSAIAGGSDVIAMPRYYQPWEAGLPALRTHLRKIDDIKYFSAAEKTALKRRLQEAGLASTQANSMAILGRAHPALAVFDPASLQIKVIIRAD